MASIACILLLSTVMATGNLTNQDQGEVVIVSVDSTNLRFSPETITLQEGDTVRFLWSGELLAHNAVERDGLFDSGETSRNVDYSYTFKIGENGTYEYVCEPHEELGMIGTIIVESIPPMSKIRKRNQTRAVENYRNNLGGLESRMLNWWWL